MSLLLDARKKVQQAQSAQQDAYAAMPAEAGREGAGEHPAQTADQARNAGHNLFAAKSRPSLAVVPGRNLLYALAGTLLLLAAGMIYLWYLNSSSSTTPLQTVSAQPAMPVRPIQPAPAVQQPAMQDAVAEAEAPDLAGNAGEDLPPAPATKKIPPETAQQPQDRTPPHTSEPPIRIEPKKIEAIDPLLGDAYLAYRSGKLDDALRLYLELLKKDANHPDALLGLAAIAQQRGEIQAAAQYFGRALALDPRNAAANAGMVSLGADEDYGESRLKILLREQGNSAVLHFALGNLYAGQSRWSEAQQAYFNAYTLEPGNAEFAFNLAVSLDRLGQRKPAAQHYQRALQLDTSHSAGFDHAQITLRAQELAR